MKAATRLVLHPHPHSNRLRKRLPRARFGGPTRVLPELLGGQPAPRPPESARHRSQRLGDRTRQPCSNRLCTTGARMRRRGFHPQILQKRLSNSRLECSCSTGAWSCISKASVRCIPETPPDGSLSAHVPHEVQHPAPLASDWKRPSRRSPSCNDHTTSVASHVKPKSPFNSACPGDLPYFAITKPVPVSLGRFRWPPRARRPISRMLFGTVFRHSVHSCTTRGHTAPCRLSSQLPALGRAPVPSAPRAAAGPSHTDYLESLCSVESSNS